MTITFYAKALNANGVIEQMKVTKEPGQMSVPVWTGKCYRSNREADKDIKTLNGCDGLR